MNVQGRPRSITRGFASGCVAWVIAYLLACYAFWGVGWVRSLAFEGGASILPTGEPSTIPFLPVPSASLVLVLSPVTVPLILIAGSVFGVLGLIVPDLRPAVGGSLLAWLEFLLPLGLTRLLVGVIMRRDGTKRVAEAEGVAVAQPPVAGCEAPEEDMGEAAEPKGNSKADDSAGVPGRPLNGSESDGAKGCDPSRNS